MGKWAVKTMLNERNELLLFAHTQTISLLFDCKMKMVNGNVNVNVGIHFSTFTISTISDGILSVNIPINLTFQNII